MENKVSKKEYTNVSDFESVQEVVIYMGCKYKREEQRDDTKYIYLNFNTGLYDENNNSNEKFFNTMSSYIASVLKYSNFVMIDNSKKITIEVTCDKTNKKITSMLINGQNDYYVQEESKKQINEFKEIKETNIKVDSEILQKLINVKWKTANAKFGTKTGTVDKYDLYQEGLKVKKVGTKVFNIVFTKEYKNNVVNSLKVGDDFEKVKNTLGNPTFEQGQIIGYKGKNIYVFFQKDEISIYRVEDEQNDEFNKFINNLEENTNLNDIANKLTDIWGDYDLYENTGNSLRIRYSLRGIELVYNSSKQGVVLYNNYINLKNMNEIPKHVYIEADNDLVFLTEKSRNKGNPSS